MSDSPYQAPNSAVAQASSDPVGSVPPTTGFVFRFLWACFWRSALISIPLMFMAGMLTAGIFAGLDLGSLANPMASLVTFIVSLAVWIPVTKRVIGKRLGTHKLVVVAAS